MTYALNVSSVDKCSACADTGWVELVGTVKRHGVDYSRGTAPCKWCEQGRNRYAHMVAERQYPDTNFTLADVVMPDVDPRPFKPDADFLREMERDFGTPRAVLRMLYPRRIWPSEWPAEAPAEVVEAIPGETRRDVEAKRKVEQDRLATVELPVESAPAQPDYSDVPF